MGIEDRIQELERYYRQRAPEYEEIYDRADPIRKRELGEAAARMNEVLKGRRVLEIACGTGYWTQVAAEVAEEIVATDISPEMIDLAGRKPYTEKNVRFITGDAYRLDEVPGDFNAGLANFWISHVPLARMHAFIRGFHKRLATGSPVFMVDNMNTPGHGGEFLREPDGEDTFKLRELNDGSRHTIIKNYFDSDELRGLFEPYVRNLRFDAGTYYWWLSYIVRAD